MILNPQASWKKKQERIRRKLQELRFVPSILFLGEQERTKESFNQVERFIQTSQKYLHRNSWKREDIIIFRFQKRLKKEKKKHIDTGQ